jgi:N-methylhydantoinase B
MLGALSRACPDLVSADIHRTSFHNLIGGIDPATGSEFVHYEWACGGNGGFKEADGPSAMAAIDWGDLTTVQPTEVLESRFPLHIEWTQLGLDSGGAGERRGGLGMRRALRLTRGNAVYSLLSDGAIMPPFGIHGGETGAPVDSYVIGADGSEHHFDSPGKVGGHAIAKGDTVILQSAAGGGYGDPLVRPMQDVWRDVKNDIVSVDIARRVYGVCFDDDGNVLEDATMARRREISAARPSLTTVQCTKDPYVASGPSKRRTIRLHPDDIERASLEVGQKIELYDQIGPPLRGWLVADLEVEPRTVPVDERATALLGLTVNQSIMVRPLYTPKVFYRAAPVQ